MTGLEVLQELLLEALSRAEGGEDDPGPESGVKRLADVPAEDTDEAAA